VEEGGGRRGRRRKGEREMVSNYPAWCSQVWLASMLELLLVLAAIISLHPLGTGKPTFR
jgi:hypothetical protein